ncbi:MAG TPA: TadE/TadG family type IV pilus assembly protein [Candidatus Sulfotelmatobacter sp.]|nr:TadE/TadG family type IV pilus assembly protein [Candidatus Sulfotelmatobacter sp.]
MRNTPLPIVSVTRRNLRRESGQTNIEFVFVVIMWMVMVLSIIEMVVMLHTYNVLADAAKEGVRYAIVHGRNNNSPVGPACPCTDIDGPPAPGGRVAGYGSGFGVVKTFAQYSGHSTSGMTVTVNYPGGDATPANKTPNRVQVIVSYPYQPLFGLGWPRINVNAAAEGRIIN